MLIEEVRRIMSVDAEDIRYSKSKIEQADEYKVWYTTSLSRRIVLTKPSQMYEGLFQPIVMV